MRKVLVPMAVLRLAPDTIAPLHFVRETYIRKLLKHGLLPVFISVSTPWEGVEELYELSDGVMCVGGGDFDSALWGAPLHAKANLDGKERDTTEIALIQRSIKDKKPFLGICRGCQGLAVAAGGSINQHLPDTTEEDHGVGEGRTYDDLAKPEGRHVVHLEPDSKISELLQQETILTNTGHHQAVDAPGKDLRISGRSEGGIVEVIEHVDPDYFCFGIQSHPEAEEPGSMDPVFKAFAKAVEQHGAALPPAR